MKKAFSKSLAILLAVAMIVTMVFTVHAATKYQNASNPSKEPGIVTGSIFEVEAVVNISELSGQIVFNAGTNAAGETLTVRYGLNGIGMLIISNGADDYSRAYFDWSQRFDVNQDVTLKLAVSGNAWKVSVNDTEILNVSDDAYIPVDTSVFFINDWGANYVLKSLKITTPDEPADPNVLYETTTATTSGIAPNVVTGSKFVVEMVINPSAFTNEYGNIAMIAGKDAAGNEVCFQMSKDNTLGLNGTNNHVEPAWGNNILGSNLHTDISIKLVVNGKTWTAFANDEQIWTATDDRLLVTEDSKFEVKSWEVTFTIKSLKLTKLETQEEQETPTMPYEMAEPVNIVNDKAGNADGFVPNITTGNKFEAEVVVNISSLGIFKLSLGTNTDGKIMSIEFGSGYFCITADALWIHQDWSKNFLELNKDVTIKVAVDGEKLTLSVDGAEIYSDSNASYALEEDAQMLIATWNSIGTIKHLTLKELSDSEPDPTVGPDPTVNPEPTVDPDPTVGPDPTVNPEPPETGDVSPAVPIVLALLSVASLGIVIKKKGN